MFSTGVVTLIRVVRTIWDSNSFQMWRRLRIERGELILMRYPVGELANGDEAVCDKDNISFGNSAFLHLLSMCKLLAMSYNAIIAYALKHLVWEISSLMRLQRFTKWKKSLCWQLHVDWRQYLLQHLCLAVGSPKLLSHWRMEQSLLLFGLSHRTATPQWEVMHKSLPWIFNKVKKPPVIQ